MTNEPSLTVSDKARAKVLELRAGESDPERLALWVEVTGAQGGDYSYDMWFQPVEDASEGDAVAHHDDLTVVIPATSVDKLRGATLDMSRDLLRGGMVIVNPNRPSLGSPSLAPLPPGELTGDVAQRVSQVLERQINPGIAAHGGRADLVAVEGDTVYLRLSGGCQGCGMAAVTLGQGIEVAIREAVPEVLHVVDTTDHASGTNPYFEPAKK